MTRLSLHFLGVGNASAHELGSSAAVLEEDGSPLLLIDCGPQTLRQFAAAYGTVHPLPSAVFITHLHLDHIGDLEALFYRAALQAAPRALCKLFVPASLIDALNRRLCFNALSLAEGRVNIWDAFQLIPVDEYFWLDGMLFKVLPARHHGYRKAFSLHLPGWFYYTGDTRPVPELLSQFACAGETVFHDCGIRSNPSHTGVDELPANYEADLLERMVLYHYESEASGDQLEALGYRVARPGHRFALRAVAQPVDVPGERPPGPPGGERYMRLTGT